MFESKSRTLNHLNGNPTETTVFFLQKSITATEDSLLLTKVILILTNLTFKRNNRKYCRFNNNPISNGS